MTAVKKENKFDDDDDDYEYIKPEGRGNKARKWKRGTRTSTERHLELSIIEGTSCLT